MLKSHTDCAYTFVRAPSQLLRACNRPIIAHWNRFASSGIHRLFMDGSFCICPWCRLHALGCCCQCAGLQVHLPTFPIRAVAAVARGCPLCFHPEKLSRPQSGSWWQYHYCGNARAVAFAICGYENVHVLAAKWIIMRGKVFVPRRWHAVRQSATPCLALEHIACCTVARHAANEMALVWQTHVCARPSVWMCVWLAVVANKFIIHLLVSGYALSSLSSVILAEISLWQMHRPDHEATERRQQIDEGIITPPSRRLKCQWWTHTNIQEKQLPWRIDLIQ